MGSDFRAELKKGSDRLSELVRANSQLQGSIDSLEAESARLKSDRDNFRAQLEYIKREDVLDESGRQRPILIQSNHSSLLERLQINEFLYEAQQSRTPIPLVVEKIAQVLELLHSAQSQADQYLADVSKSNTLVAALRQKNMRLFEQVQEYEQFKTRSLIRYVGNQLEAGSVSMLYLDGLHMTEREVQEVHNLMRQYEVLEQVRSLVFADNGFTDDLINLFLQIIFSIPYMQRLDLRRNAFSHDAVKKLQTHCQNIQGVTSVIWRKEPRSRSRTWTTSSSPTSPRMQRTRTSSQKPVVCKLPCPLVLAVLGSCLRSERGPRTARATVRSPRSRASRGRRAEGLRRVTKRLRKLLS